jgi:parallel beta-helix repeat protein
LIFVILALFIGVGIQPAIADIIKEPSKPLTKDRTLYVGGTGPGNYTTIQDAIDHAANGDTVFVYNGTYYENLMIERSIKVIGEDKNTTIIDGQGKSIVIWIWSDYVKISGFTIRNHFNFDHDRGFSGIETRYGQNFCCFSNNIILNTRIAIGFWGETKSSIVTHNTLINGKTGILLEGGSDCVVSNNSIKNFEYGINTYYLETINFFINNQFEENEHGLQIRLGPNSGKVYHNNFIRNKRDIIFWQEGPFRYHTKFKPVFTNNYYDNFAGIGPKKIKGRAEVFAFPIVIPFFPFLFFIPLSIRWRYFEWHPTKEPFDIEI